MSKSQLKVGKIKIQTRYYFAETAKICFLENSTSSIGQALDTTTSIYLHSQLQIVLHI